MCVFGSPKTQPVKNIIPQSTPLPEKAPDPVEIKKDGQTKTNKKRNPLRIDLATQTAASANTGVNV
jgi:hypothetical protein